MAGETELETLLVRLVADSSEYVDELKEAEKESLDFAKSITDLTQTSKVSFESTAVSTKASLTSMGEDVYEFVDAGYKLVDTLEEATAARKKFTDAFAQQVMPVGPMQGPMPVGNLTQMPTFVKDTQAAKGSLDEMLLSLDDEEAAVRRTSKAHGSLNLSIRDTRHALHLISATTGVGGAMAHEAMLGVYAYHILHKSVKSLGEAMMANKAVSAIAFTGIGIVGAGTIGLYKVYEKFKEQQKEIAELTKKAFSEIGSGAETVSAAIGGIKVEGQSKAIADIAEKMHELIETTGSPLAMGLRQLNIFAPTVQSMSQMINVEVNKAIAKMNEAKAIADAIAADPAMKSFIDQQQTDKANQSIAKQVDELKKEKLLFGMSAADKKAYGVAAELAIKQNISLAAAIQKTNTARLRSDELERAARDAGLEEYKEQQKTLQGLSDKRGALEDEAGAIGMAKIQAERYTEIRKIAREQNIDLAEAESMYGKALDEIAQAQAKVAASKEFTGELNKLNDEAAKNAVKLTQGAEAAERFAMAQKIARETGQSVTEVLEENSAQLAKIKNAQDTLAGQKVWEETRTPLEKYGMKLQDLDRLLQSGKIDQELYNRAVNNAQKELLDAGAAMQKVDYALSGSADFFSKLEEQQNKTTKPLNLSIGSGGGSRPEGSLAASPESLSKQDKQIDLLMGIKKASEAVAAKPGVGLVAAPF